MASNEDNPFLSLVGFMREQGEINNPVPFYVGTVATAEPLTVQIGDITISRDVMKVNAFLLKGYSRRLRLDETGATGQTEEKSDDRDSYEAFSSHSHNQRTIGIPDGTYTTLDDFSEGDEVLLLMSADQQQFILICKLM